MKRQIISASLQKIAPQNRKIEQRKNILTQPKEILEKMKSLRQNKKQDIQMLVKAFQEYKKLIRKEKKEIQKNDFETHKRMSSLPLKFDQKIDHGQKNLELKRKQAKFSKFCGNKLFKKKYSVIEPERKQKLVLRSYSLHPLSASGQASVSKGIDSNKNIASLSSPFSILIPKIVVVEKNHFVKNKIPPLGENLKGKSISLKNKLQKLRKKNTSELSKIKINHLEVKAYRMKTQCLKNTTKISPWDFTAPDESLYDGKSVKHESLNQ